MPSLICALEDLLASWKAEARAFDACDMPASALAFRDCHRRLCALLDDHVCQAASPTAALAGLAQQSSVTELQPCAIAPMGS
ncbi:hypothetical protein [Xanthomonas prunicola]|jgi:hypothetical protein|uniref:Uncharacterized protein n=1 Tax=Xanthomonas prunicola TaxID=2053930 RepID=A0A2N3RPT6_9XANT|nr:hypothetical protein [Xanthomonas prunicola]PKV14523.1 hypothetical protein XpruCFBP8353_05640 [Xanthomonas prunicola]PKV18805.1 hypothetical protein XpruCFBP8354_05640 [Xanthomonas prunicola]PKV21887.1 hypothetical protein CVO74_00815 [Xanthomonas prunicola]